MIDMAERYGGKVAKVVKPWGSAFTLDEIRAGLEQYSPKIVGIVHAVQIRSPASRAVVLNVL